MKTIQEEFPPPASFGFDRELADAYTRLRARAVEMERAQRWRPLTDAPSSSPCLITDGESVEKARWMPRLKKWRFPHAKLRIEPTYWQPLPPAPDHHQPKP